MGVFYPNTTSNSKHWIAFQADQLHRKMKTNPLDLTEKTKFITISREYGCAGYSLGEILAAELNKDSSGNGNSWSLYDKKLFMKIEEEHGIHQTLLSTLTEKSRGEIEGYLSSIFADTPSQLSVCRKVFSAIRALALKGNTIVVGRGASAVTRDLPGGFHIRIYAPTDWRVARIQSQSKGISRSEAAAIVEKATKEREAFVQKFLKVSVNDSSLYNIMLNHSRLNRLEMANTILAALRL